MLTSAPPRMPPINPPAACSPAQPSTPPHEASAVAGMKNEPMIKPATAAETTEAATATAIVDFGLVNVFSYPASLEVASKTMLAAVKPKKITAAGFMAKFTAVAMRPTAVNAIAFVSTMLSRSGL